MKDDTMFKVGFSFLIAAMILLGVVLVLVYSPCECEFTSPCVVEVPKNNTEVRIYEDLVTGEKVAYRKYQQCYEHWEDIE